jgi:16S rRNA (cytosine1402-N4)-methyltransferase
MSPPPKHVPVLAEEVIRLADPQPGQTWVDCTTGGGGHAKLIAERLGGTGRLIGLDQDATMLDRARPVLSGLPVTLLHANFDQLAEALQSLNIEAVDGVLADLGFASDQMDDRGRGLSFRDDGPLDMRLNPESGSTAADLVNRMSEGALADVFFEFGEERHSRRVAKRIVERRAAQPFTTTADLAEIVRRSVPRSGGIDPATRVFQALRIAVNDELGALDRLLATLPNVVKPGGKAAIISFHSLEDRRVKLAFKSDSWRPLTKKPVEAGDEETSRNPRSRSAKLRVAERLTTEAQRHRAERD